MQNKKKIKNDIILTAVILAIALFAFLIFKLSLKTGAYACVTYDGEQIGMYPLNTDMTVRITSGENDENFNILVIKDGRAYISEASCPDGICSEHRATKNVGETIVCLPNKIVVTIIGEGSESDVDLVS